MNSEKIGKEWYKNLMYKIILVQVSLKKIRFFKESQASHLLGTTMFVYRVIIQVNLQTSEVEVAAVRVQNDYSR